MRKVLLIDGDIIAYELSASTQRSYDLPEADSPVVTADADAAIAGMRDRIDGWAKEFKADHVIVCLSDDFSNFRKKVLPSYKSHRTGERPVLLYDMKDALGDYYEIARWPNLEADDVMGIMATEPQTEERRCIVSADKDMATIPGWVFNPLKDKKPRKISPEDAERWFFKQVLMGDATDGYKGCPGVGPKAADQIVDQDYYFAKHEREITRGKRKGEIEVKWKLERSIPTPPVWDRIVTAFQSKGLTEEDALVQARCAFILHHGYYDDGRVTPWNP